MTPSDERDSVFGIAPQLRVDRTSPSRVTVSIVVSGSVEAADKCDPESQRNRDACIDRLAKAAPQWITDNPVDEPGKITRLELDEAIRNAKVQDSAERPAEVPRQGRPIVFETLEPWPDPVDGAELLDDIVAVVTKYVTLDGPAAVACATWSVHTWCFQRFDATPRLLLSSAVPGAGKSTLLRVLGCLAHKPRKTGKATPSVLARLTSEHHPTWLLDEADKSIVGTESENIVAAIIDDGFEPDGVYSLSIRQGDDWTACEFGVFTPMAIAGIDTRSRFAPTVRSRSIVIALEPRPRDADWPRLRTQRLRAELLPLRRRIARWVADHGPELEDAEPRIDAVLREADKWRPLMAVADEAGGNWSVRVRSAAGRLSGEATDTLDVGVQLLGDLRELFEERGTDRIKTADILKALNSREDRPWPEWKGKGPLSPRQLAVLLSRFNLSPRDLRTDGGSKMGYRLAELSVPFAKYLPPRSPS